MIIKTYIISTEGMIEKNQFSCNITIYLRFVANSKILTMNDLISQNLSIQYDPIISANSEIVKIIIQCLDYKNKCVLCRFDKYPKHISSSD